MITLSRRINAPVERVFGLMVDIENAAENIPGILAWQLLITSPKSMVSRMLPYWIRGISQAVTPPVIRRLFVPIT